MDECGQPQTCTGGTYGLMCTGINECSKDLNGIYTPVNYSSKACLGVECEPPEYMCVDQIYPCHGISQMKVCDKEAQCISKDYADDRVCAGITECIAPKEIILSKMDYNSREYVDAPQSFWGWMGGKKDGTCEGESAYYTFKEVHNTDYGAYAPYNESILSFYAKAHYIYDDNRQTKENCAYICGCGIRIGFDEQNYIEYESPCPKLMYWTKYTIDLKNKPIDSKGTVDWNQIKYFRLRFGAAQMLCNRCSPCFGNIDYITLER